MRYSLLRWRRLHGRQEPDFPVPFVVGATRSGTTLLRLMLDAHPDLAIPYETHFIPDVIDRCEKGSVDPEILTRVITRHKRWHDLRLEREELEDRLEQLHPLNAADAIRTVYRLYAEKQGKPRWGDKTPGYVKEMRRIQRVLPEARFVHIVRDGRDVALSLLSRSFGPTTVEEAAKLWRNRIRKARRQAPELRHYMEIHYEDLILDTEGSLRRICEFAGLEFDPVMLDYHERAQERLEERNRMAAKGRERKNPPKLKGHQLAMQPPREDQIGKWRSTMSAEDVASYEAVAGEVLAELGYDVTHQPAAATR